MAFPAELKSHLAGGATTLCRCWALTRNDGVVLGFTDHDLDLEFDGIRFVADSGMSASALEQTTGLAVDNSEALGILTSSSVTETDIRAGRYDGAAVKAWLVNWADVSQRIVLFAGSIGEIARSGRAFRAELRGLTEKLNQPQGRVFQKSCGAVLGDKECGFDLDQPGFSAVLPVDQVRGSKFLEFDALDGFADRWFEKGRIVVMDGAAQGLTALIKNDRLVDDKRCIELWEALGADLAAGDSIRIEAGCDRRLDTCRLKFDNILNFRGFPAIPGEDWLMSVPRRGDLNDGGSLGS